MMKNTYVSIVRAIDRKKTGLALYQLRASSGYTMENICDFLGLESSRAIYKWEAGQSMPTLDHLVALCNRVYGVPLESVLRYAGESDDSPVAHLIQNIVSHFLNHRWRNRYGKETERKTEKRSTAG